jgi:hypothetical protein
MKTVEEGYVVQIRLEERGKKYLMSIDPGDWGITYRPTGKVIQADFFTSMHYANQAGMDWSGDSKRFKLIPVQCITTETETSTKKTIKIL